MDDPRSDPRSTEASVELLWIPLGAGDRVVRLSGEAFEAVCARLAARPRRALYHSALVVTLDGQQTTIEVGPVRRGPGAERGVVAVGPVGSRWLRRLRVFRYEVRRWPGGTIPDAAEAVGGPVVVTREQAAAQQVIDAVPAVPVPTWGRDELRCGEMWNSNSVTSWLLVAAGLDAGGLHPPGNGRAPGWDAGVVEGRRRRSRDAAQRSRRLAS